MSGPSGSVRASVRQRLQCDDLSTGFASAFPVRRMGSARTCTRTRIPVNCHPSRARAAQQIGASLPYDGCDRADVGRKFQLSVPLLRDPNAELRWAAASVGVRFPRALPRDRDGPPSRPASRPSEECVGSVAGNASWQARAAALRAGEARRQGKVGRNPIEHHSRLGRHGAGAKPQSLDWRHWTLGGLALAVIFVAFTGVFNFLTLRYAAAIQHPWLQAIVLADQRQEAERTQELVCTATSTRWRCAWASCRRG